MRRTEGPAGCLVLAASLSLLSVGGTSAQSPDAVSNEDVKRFLDPTQLINSFDYSFQASILPLGMEAYTHRLSPTWALGHRTAVWAEVPMTHFSSPGEAGSASAGDVTLGWGWILHEDLERRLTTSIGAIEVVAPTGSVEDGTGSGRFMLQPVGAIALNPTDYFPVYLSGQYTHSFGGSEGEPVRRVELSVETVHIFPKGFFVSAVPTFFWDFGRDVEVFSLGLGVGRALSSHFAWSAAYVQHLVGDKTFSRGFNAGLSFIWGDEKVAPPPTR